MGSYSQQQQWSSWAYPGMNDAYVSYSQLPENHYLVESLDPYSVHQNHLVHHQMARTTESKPRLSKEEVEVLEAEFQKNHKPNSSTKKALAESMRVDHARINNWFQNRRAREKKENNIREYEARQRAEKEKADAAVGRHESDRKRDLVASSAPFPEPRQSKQDSPEASSERSMSEDALTLQSEEDQLSSTEDDVKSEQLSEDIHDYFSIPDADVNLSGHGLALSNSGMVLPMGGDDVERYMGSYEALEMNQSASYAEEVASPQKQLQSPLPMDIGSRRHRRPPPLAITGSRSFSGVARLSADMSRRAEQCNSMRRVSSANGAGRVTKVTSASRSPFLQRQKSPVTRPSVAPPTPDTPIVQTMNVSGAMPPATKYSSSALLQDPTLRTPPTTPGLVDNMLNAGAAFDMSLNHDDLISSSVGSFPSDFELSASMSYLSSTKDCSSQPVTPLFAPQIGPGYFNIYAGNAECYWSDASTSGRSSPGLKMQQSQFMTM